MVFLGIKDIFIPLLIHMAVSNAVALALQGSTPDAAAVTAVAAVLSLPFFIFLYLRDRRECPTGKPCIPRWVYPLMAAGGAALNLCQKHYQRHRKCKKNLHHISMIQRKYPRSCQNCRPYRNIFFQPLVYQPAE